MNLTGFNNEVNLLHGREEIRSEMIDVLYPGNTREIHQDLEVALLQYTTIWGRLTDHEGNPLVGEWIKLMRSYTYEGREYAEVVGIVQTDSSGCYEINLLGNDLEAYSISVQSKESSKAMLSEGSYRIEEKKMPEVIRNMAMPISNVCRTNSQPYKATEIYRKQPSYYTF